MPTENRSSNTEQMVSVPREWVENYAGLLEERCAYKASERVQAVLAQPATQHQGDPVAFYREFVDGREYCEKPFTNDWTPLYTHADAGEVERLHNGHVKSLEALNQQSEKQRDHWIDECKALRAQLAERDALLKRQPSFINTLETFEADDGTFVRLSDVLGALSASAEPIPFPGYPPVPEDRKLPAEPSAQVERDENAAFESWARSRITPLKLQLDEIGLYHDLVAGTAHDAWQARAALERKS